MPFLRRHAQPVQMRGEALVEALEVEQGEMRRMYRHAPLQVEQGGVFGVLG